MDKYHIYEEIGKGEFSQVFKGREKKKIEYVAIKRIEKSMMPKVVSEVQVMHKLSCAHMLKFHDWYETRNNLWLILEYCTGGDLAALIKQDGHLPETSVRIFGLDIVAAIKYMHGEGMLHCDIRPCNFLVDEYGILKLSDFKNVRKIPKEPLGETPMNSRGTPDYMSPELFTPEGMHSYQSDFWAIGVVLYQLRRGSLPFGDENTPLPRLIENVRTVDPVHNPLPLSATGESKNSDQNAHPPVTADLADLLQWLLEKNPANRGNWESICAHPFWQPHNPVPPTKLPDQPAFESYTRNLERAQSALFENSSILEFGVKLDGSVEGIARTGSGGGGHGDHGSTPLKLPQTVDSTPIRVNHHNNNKHNTDPSTPPRDPAVDNNNTSNVNTTGVHITPERNNSGAQQAAYALANKSTARTPSTTTNTTHTNNNTTNLYNNPTSTTNAINNNNNNITVPARAVNTTTLLNNNLPGSGFANGPSTTVASNRNQNVGSSNEEEFPVYNLLLHSSDTQVKPIVGNKSIEAVDNITYKETLPFATLSHDQLASMSPSELEQHLTVVYKFLQKTVLAAQSNTAVNTVVTGVLADRVNAISYLYNIATSAEVANVVLNSHFVYLLLKITKTNIVYSTTTRMTSTTNTAANTLVNTMNANAYTSRVLSITTLAMMLRYATILNPPTIRMREEHIVVTIVNLLNTSSATNTTTIRERGNTPSSAVDKIDVKFRRRLVAALGEVVFYISAQEDPDSSSDASDRWALPSQAVDTLVDYCLKEDQDEVVKHYAVKTIENVFAQGAIEFKRRFVSVDLCVRLLELSLHGKNDVLQASAGMAAAHLVHLVLTAHHYPPSQSNNNLNDTGTLKSTLNTSGRVNLRTNNTLNTTNTIALNDIFTIPSTIKSARFVSKVLEKCSLNGLVDVLKDGPAKLQQSYLNIINLVFSAPIPNPNGNNTNTVDTTTAQSINATLRLPRAYFTKSTAILPILLNLSEQGALSAVRGKALLTCQLLCNHNTPFLAVLTERRLPSLLLRVLSPVFATLETNNTLNAAELSYFIKTALSMVYFMRNSVHTACTTLCEQLTTLVSDPNSIYSSAYTTEGANGGGNSAYESPVKGGASSVNLFQSARKAGAASPAKGSTTTDNATGATVNVAVLHTNATILSSVASTASQPALRKLLYSISGPSGTSGGGSNSINSVCSVIQLLPQVYSVLDTLYRNLHSTTLPATASNVKNKHTQSPVVDNKSVLANVEEGVNAVERSCLMSLETLAQIEFSENTPASFAFLSSLLTTLLPASILLLEHKSGDTRVVVTSVLRRLVPSVLHAAVRFSTFFQEAENINEANRIFQSALTMLPTLLLQVPSLLQDQAPIPQYTVRLLCDVLTINTTISSSVVQSLVGTGSVEVLIQLLKQKRDEEGEGIDSQLIVLVRTIFESNGAEHLLQNDLATSLVTALISCVYGSMNSTVSSCSMVTGRRGDTITSPEGVVNQHQTIIVLIDLLHIVLHFVLRAVSTADERDRQYSAAHHTQSRAYYVQAEGYHKQVAPLRAISPALLMIFAYVSAYLRDSTTTSTADNNSTQSNHSDNSEANALLAYCHLLDSSSRSLGIIFDLFPDAVTVQLLAKHSILLDNGSTGGSNTRAVLTPRMVFADILVNPEVELKARIRLMKIVAGVCRMSASMELGAKSKEMLLSAPLNTTLVSCSRASEIAAHARTFRGQSVNVDDINVFVRLATQVLEMANRL